MLPAFAQGGSFRVGGSGGTDSQLVAFRAVHNAILTPNEARAPEHHPAAKGGDQLMIQGATAPRAALQ